MKLRSSTVRVGVLLAIAVWPTSWAHPEERPPAAEQSKGSGPRLYPVTVDGKTGFIDESGKLVFTLSPEVYTVLPFTEGLAAIAVGVRITSGQSIPAE